MSIVLYLENHRTKKGMPLAEKTKHNYLCSLRQIQNHFGDTDLLTLVKDQEQEIHDYIYKGMDCCERNRNRYAIIFVGYCHHHSITLNLFQDTFAKQKRDNEEHEDRPREVLDLYSFQDTFTKTKGDIPTEYRLLLSLLLFHDTVLRTDLASVKFTGVSPDDHRLEGNTIVFGKLNKVGYKKDITLTLTPEEHSWATELVNNNVATNYLFTCNANDRSNAYSKTIKRITKSFLGKELTQRDFREMRATEVLRQAQQFSHSKARRFIEERAKLRGHSASTSSQFYENPDTTCAVIGDSVKTIEFQGKVYTVSELFKCQKKPVRKLRLM